MLFSFIDESCFPKPSDESKYSVILAVCIRDDNIRDLTQKMYNIKTAIYGGNPDVEVKAKKLIVPATIKYNRTKNKGFVERIMSMAESYCDGVFALVMERPDYTPYTPSGYLPKHYKYLLQKVDLHCQRRNARLIAAPVFDAQEGKADEIMCSGLNNLIFRAGELVRIMEMPLFVSSRLVPGIQLADIMAGIVRHHYCRPDSITDDATSDFYTWVSQLYGIVRGISPNYHLDHRTEFGIQVCNKNFLPRRPDEF